MLEATTQSYTELYGKDKPYFSMRYSPGTAAGLLEIDESHLFKFMHLWDRPEENPPEHVRNWYTWKVCWLDFVQCQFLVDLQFQQDFRAAEMLISGLISRFDDRYPTALEHMWTEDCLEKVWSTQQDTELPADLTILENNRGELVPTAKARQFLNRIHSYDINGIAQELILQAPSTPDDEPILIHPGRKSGYPTIKGHLIEFIGGLYRAHGWDEVKKMYHDSPLTDTEAWQAIHYTDSHYIEPMD